MPTAPTSRASQERGGGGQAVGPDCSTPDSWPPAPPLSTSVGTWHSSLLSSSLPCNPPELAGAAKAWAPPSSPFCRGAESQGPTAPLSLPATAQRPRLQEEEQLCRPRGPHAAPARASPRGQLPSEHLSLPRVWGQHSQPGSLLTHHNGFCCRGHLIGRWPRALPHVVRALSPSLGDDWGNTARFTCGCRRSTPRVTGSSLGTGEPGRLRTHGLPHSAEWGHSNTPAAESGPTWPLSPGVEGPQPPSRPGRTQEPGQGGGTSPRRCLPRQVLPSAWSRKPNLHSQR